MSAHFCVLPDPNPTQRPLSTQMRAVLLILEADPYLKAMLLPHIDLVNESIHWDGIFKIAYASGHRAAVTFMCGVWTDELRARANPFGSALNMTPRLQAACLQALALRWGLNR